MSKIMWRTFFLIFMQQNILRSFFFFFCYFCFFFCYYFCFFFCFFFCYFCYFFRRRFRFSTSCPSCLRLCLHKRFFFIRSHTFLCRFYPTCSFRTSSTFCYIRFSFIHYYNITSKVSYIVVI